MALRLRRGTDVERQSITPLEGELIYVTDTRKVYVGASQNSSLIEGGVLVSSQIIDDTNPELGGDLSLGGHNIVGTGNININGTITATGNINLGDGAEDNVIVGGQIASSLIPSVTSSFNLGDSLAKWDDIYTVRINADGATIDGQLSAGSIVTDGSIIKSDSTVIYDGATGNLTVSGVVEAAGIKGSVFGDDSITLVDGITGNISNGTISLVDDFIIGITSANSYDTNLSSTDPIIVIGTKDQAHSLLIEGGSYPLSLRGKADGGQGIDISLQAARYSGITPTSVFNSDTLGSVIFEGYNGAEYKKASILTSIVESPVNGGGNFSTKLEVSVLNAAGLYSQFTFRSDGVFDAGLGIKVYNGTDAELGGFASIATTGTFGYGADRSAPVFFNGSVFTTLTSVVATPSGPTAAGKAGQISGDADYIYFCYGDSTWIRAAKDGTWT
tara:strand:- start:20982 stop:22313 length:1332 start_codon:yes stop_codon:yes gene_type:complete